jgi:hypothetical protein
MPADADKSSGPACLCRFGEIDDFGNVRQIIAGERDHLRLPALQQAKIGAVILDLQIDEPDVVSSTSRRLRDELEPQRFEPQEDLCVEQWPRMDTEKTHATPSRKLKPRKANVPRRDRPKAPL